MDIILGKYKMKRRLARSLYSQVLLVQDSNGQEYALKMISKKIQMDQNYLQKCFKGQKDFMMSIKSKYIMQLVKVQEDENYVYLVCEYCDGGDLLNYQTKQVNKVFTLKQTTRILAQIIKGLQILHKMQYVHRNIKPQNILLKKHQNGEYLFKLGDLIFAKKAQSIGGTVLGTENYMSPQIYINDICSFEVDMWAFGVLMFFMLNLDFPFKISPHLSWEEKSQELYYQSHNFSYEKIVKKSRKKLLQNCNNLTEDLFRKMFEPDPKKRITFSQIREHPLFKEYFSFEEIIHSKS